MSAEREDEHYLSVLNGMEADIEIWSSHNAHDRAGETTIISPGQTIIWPGSRQIMIKIRPSCRRVALMMSGDLALPTEAEAKEAFPLISMDVKPIPAQVMCLWDAVAQRYVPISSHRGVKIQAMFEEFNRQSEEISKCPT